MVIYIAQEHLEFIVMNVLVLTLSFWIELVGYHLKPTRKHRLKCHLCQSQHDLNNEKYIMYVFAG